MHVGLAISASGAAQDRASEILSVSDSLARFFETRSYGASVESVVIGLVIFEPPYSTFFKRKRPKYYEGDRTITTNGLTAHVRNSLSFEVWIDYDIFVKEERITGLLASEILRAVDTLRLPAKVKSFRLAEFTADLALILTECATDRDAVATDERG